jgi:hypothetical protein
MNSLSSFRAFMPFPAIPPPLAGQFGGAEIRLRRFGVEENDLEIDFAASDTPALITRIIHQCAAGLEGSALARLLPDLSVGKRLECLLVLASGSEGSYSFPFSCAGCGKEIELELTLDDISAQQRKADLLETVGVEIEGRRAEFRKPTGRDQENWGRMIFRDEQEAARAIFGTLTVSPVKWEALEEEDFGRIEEALHEADPLVNFVCHVTCEECGQQNEFPIDLCDAALGLLHRIQKQMIVMVHRLASHYHWSEKEIFEVPRWRRIEYLELIAAGR